MSKSISNDLAINMTDEIYQWLEDFSCILIELDIEKTPDTYRPVLKKIYSEGLENLSKVSYDNPVLISYIKRLIAETLLDLALVEKEPSIRNKYLNESFQNGKNVIEILKDNDIPGLTGQILPRIIAILGIAYQNMDGENRILMDRTLIEAVDILDKSLNMLEVERQLAVEKIFKARFLISSIDSSIMPSDRQVILEKAALLSRQALNHSRRTLDRDLEGQTEEILVFLEQAQVQSNLINPIPSLNSSNPSFNPLKALDYFSQKSKCPQCGKPVNPTAKFCRSCGITLSEDMPLKTVQRTCPNCKRTVNTNAHFCGNCGTPIQ